ncbi:major facilitator superfamily transporter MFS_1 [Thecamonas trahens ATCC 50062]|uniref:Major facilitator superfamily transporter MFS_1 n=1 Tax=Thecamonas trahens ATCC 50062 TaxID=461836 RepID=A0A0L0DJC4_THETB|nr:major facilitator superfamily transporter MFS_1 [Thecamonas trahens ATCC 50062]KNC52305.1 major facilitator superfamily transporter MFS_1 [Thecamonas trahens ATCC 50062]|eukprot:XP_013762303.1 major facilitator superfamily transporter MFS_1 [Thecamonas trahens ATCC 50062]
MSKAKRGLLATNHRPDLPGNVGMLVGGGVRSSSSCDDFGGFDSSDGGGEVGEGMAGRSGNGVEMQNDWSIPNAAGATTTLIILGSMNMLNYVDRYVPSATKELFKAELGLTDAQSALPLSVFIVVYMCASPLFGYLADSGMDRRMLLTVGVVIWSLATAAGALAIGFWTFLLARALVGVGEAAYATIAPPLLADVFAPARLPRAMALYNIGLPVGAAIGFVVGGSVGHRLGWRWAFLICGLPGLVLAAFLWRIRDPGRGYFERQRSADSSVSVTGSASEDGGESGEDKVTLVTDARLSLLGGGGGSEASDGGEASQAGGRDGETGVLVLPWLTVAGMLARNARYLLTMLGQTALTFGAGGMADWLPTFLVRYHGLTLETAGLVVGGVTVVAGIFGTLSGAQAAVFAAPRTKNANLAVSGLAMVPATAGVFLALVLPSAGSVIALTAAAQYFLWFFQGPSNSELASATPSLIRSRAFAVSIFCSHALGDAASPPIIGLVSDSESSLRTALLLVPVAMAVSAVLWLCAWRGLGKFVPPKTYWRA